MKRVLKRGAGVLLLPLLFFSILRGEAKKWTILIYMAADNSLTEVCDEDLFEIEDAAYSEKVNVVIEVDRAYPSPETNTVIYVKRENGLVKIKDLGELDTGDPETLRDFILWGVSAFPSDKYGLIIWGHGKSWDKEGNYLSKFIANDYSSGNSIDVYNGELKEAIPDSIFDFIILDACLMGGMEVIYELQGKTHYVVSSPATVPSSGFPYDSVLSLFTEDTLNTRSLLKKVVDCYAEYYSRRGDEYTISLYSLESLDSVTFYLTEVVSKLRRIDIDSLKNLRDSVFGYAILCNLNDPLSPYIDLSNLFVRCGISDSWLDLLVIYNKKSSIYENSGGIHVWFPVSLNVFENEINNYKNLSFERKTSWSEVFFHFFSREIFNNWYPQGLNISKKKNCIEVKWQDLPLSRYWMYLLKVYPVGDPVCSRTVYTKLPQVFLALLPGKYEVEVSLYDIESHISGIASPPITFEVENEEVGLYPSLICGWQNSDKNIYIYDISGREVRSVRRSGVYILKTEKGAKKVVLMILDKTN